MSGTASYLRPASVDEAVAALAGGPRTILAGGTDYFPARVGRSLDEPVLDVTAIEGLRGITASRAGHRIGALTTWTDVVRASLPSAFDTLALAAREVGGAQIQNAGTVAGNLCNASPAADGAPALMALDASVELVSARGTRTVRVERFIRGARDIDRSTDELVTAILVPAQPENASSTFLKLGARRYLVISIAMVAAVVAIDDAGTVSLARIAVGACSPVARRLHALEASLVGRPADASLAECVDEGSLAHLTPIDDVRASASYRLDAANTLVCRALEQLIA